MATDRFRTNARLSLTRLSTAIPLNILSTQFIQEKKENCGSGTTFNNRFLLD